MSTTYAEQWRRGSGLMIWGLMWTRQPQAHEQTELGTHHFRQWLSSSHLLPARIFCGPDLGLQQYFLTLVWAVSHYGKIPDVNSIERRNRYFCSQLKGSKSERASSVVFRADWHFDFVATEAENIASHKSTAQHGRKTSRPAPEVVGDSIPIPSQNSFKYFFKWSSSPQLKQPFLESDILAQSNTMINQPD